MAKRTTLFLVQSFEVALILFFLAWSASAQVQIYIPEQKPTTAPSMSESWWAWLTENKTHRFLCQDSNFFELRDGEVKQLELEPRIISVKFHQEESAIDLSFDKFFGQRKSYGFLNNDKDSDGSYALYYEPMRIHLYKRDSWGQVKLGQKKGEYSIFFRKHRRFVYHAAGTCEYTEL